MTFAAFLQQVRALSYPVGEPENLQAFSRDFVINALADIQQYVPPYQERSTTLIPFHKTKYSCGLSFVEAPDGIIQTVYSQSSNPCCKVFYRKSSLAKLRHMAAVARLEVPAHAEPTQPEGAEEDTFGVLEPDASADSTMGRANEGYWALDGACKLYLFPYLQSTEDLVVTWRGVKSDYTDTDTIYETGARLLPAVRAGVLRDTARLLDNDDAAAIKFDAIYRDEVGNLFHWAQQRVNGSWAEEERMPTITNGCLANEALASSTEPAPDPAPEETETVFAIIGSYGSTDIAAMTVSQEVVGWGPQFIITTGENNLTGIPSFGGYDSVVGSRYHPYLLPYTGAFGPGATDHNRFWPAIGPSDRDTLPMLGSYKQYFAGLPAANKLFYTRVEGPVQFFFVDSGASGTTAADSAQAQWLMLQLQASIAPFKIVVLCHPPYSSVGGGYSALRWPFKAWGATAVISGLKRVYERIVRDNMPYITLGTGGAALTDSFDSTSAVGSILRYNSDFGAIRGVVTCDALTLQFVNTEGTVVDTFGITKSGAIIAGPPTVTTSDGGTTEISVVQTTVTEAQRVYTYAGDPNGHITAPSPAVCLDTTNSILWWKNDGVTSNTGWH